MGQRLERKRAWEAAGDWSSRAACRGKRDVVFYPGPGENQEHAKAICARCPVRQECLDYAVEHEVHGIWGGAGERERKRIKRLRDRMAS